MGYVKAIDIFPKDLLARIQNYIDREYIYIPRKVANITPCILVYGVAFSVLKNP